MVELKQIRDRWFVPRIDRVPQDFVAELRACAKQKDLYKGTRLHTEILRISGLLERCPYVACTLVNMYAKCGDLARAQRVLDQLSSRTVAMWSALIAGWTQYGQGEEALKCFDRMQLDGHCPDAITYASVLKACALVGALGKAAQIHKAIDKQGLLKKDVILGNVLLHTYVKCGALKKAQEVLSELTVRDVVTWSSLISGYAECGQAKEALKCFNQMIWDRCSPNVVTYVCVLKACTILGAIEEGEQIHEEVVKQRFLEKDVGLGNALLDMYAKCGVLVKAQKVFDKLPVRNVVAWSSLIAGYTQNGHGEDALMCYDEMQNEGYSPDAVTFACALAACALEGASEKGKEIHDKIVKEGLLAKDSVLGNALLDMYAKCGVLIKVQEVFDELPVPNVVSWSTLIGAYAQHGQGERALECSTFMQRKGYKPNAVTIACILNACSHASLLDEGQMYFLEISRKYDIVPTMEHHCCMVDLFGRAGHLSKALEVIFSMLDHEYLPVWNALLAACRKWGKVTLGRFAFEHAVQLSKTDGASYVCMIYIYAAAGMFEDARMVEAMRVKNKAW